MLQMPEKGIFLTGIEGSDPLVEGVRRDQFAEAGNFYANYAERLERIRSLGITWLRVGPPYSKTHLAEDQYDLEWFDKVIVKCQELGISVMLDFLHFGLPEWMHEGKEAQFFQNPEFPYHFAKYVEVLVKRYPHISWFTPVNEPLVTATFSSQIGIWNEGLSTAEAYAQAVANIAKAAIFAKQTIERIWQEEKRQGEPYFVQNESFEEAIAGEGSSKQDEANLFNAAYRFAPMDLILGHRDGLMQEYLMSRGLSAEEYEWFMQNGNRRGVILGIDFYPNCIHVFYDDHAEHYDPTMPYELYKVATEYWARYGTPMLHTEVNGWPQHAVEICQQTFEELSRMRKEGYPVVGMSWYGDESQVDWHVGLKPLGEETPVGLFRNGELQEVGRLFSKFAREGF